MGIREGKTASVAIGYAQALAQVDGELTQEQAIESTSRLTQRYARRQVSWFKRDERIHWLDALADDLREKALELVVKDGLVRNRP
jgi:tRNA dimethylallyltransferase